MYSAHQGAEAVRAVFSSPSVNYTRDDKPASFWGLQGSVSIKDKDLTITVVNPDVHQPRETEIVLRATEIKSGAVTVLTDTDIHAHNTFENPDAVRPRSEDLAVTGSTLRHTFPPASVTLIQAKIA
jgi:alpha-L-arabinofuranosidase